MTMMAKFSEETLKNWNRPASESEEQRISNAITMIKSAINSHNDLVNKNIEVFVQGSYANNTNVRANSDVDICIIFKDIFKSKYPDGLTREDYGFSTSDYSFSTYRKSVINALAGRFGDSIKQGNKSIKINSNSYRIEADAVPSFQYRNYYYEDSRNPDNFVEGINFTTQNNQEVINYPKQHIENGKNKNNQTNRQFKRTVRIFKRIRYHMLENNQPVNNTISSFLIECLLYNVPDEYFNNYDSNQDRVKEIIRYLYVKTNNQEDGYKKWLEVSGMLYLFSNDKKWNIETVNDFLLKMWHYLEFKD